MEKKYTIRELIGMAGAAAALMGGGIAIAPKDGNSSDLHEYVSAQAVRDSVKAEDFKRLTSKVDDINEQITDLRIQVSAQNDSIKWAVKQLSQGIERIDRNGMRYGMMCDSHSDRVANR